MSWALVVGGAGPSALVWHARLLAGLWAGGADLARPDLIVGTSAGAITGARVACGLPLDAAFDIGASLTAATSWPDRPLQIVGLDAASGTPIVWTRDKGVALADAVESSCRSPVATTNAELAFGHRLVVVLAGSGPHSALDDEVKQLRAGGSHVRLVCPDEASSTRLSQAAAEAAYAQGLAMAPQVSEWLRSLPAQAPELDVDDLAARFAVPAIRRPEWTHVAHLAVGGWHVDRFGAAEALVRLREGIRRLNVSIGGQNTESSGYHETITAAYVTLIAAFLDTCPGLPLSECIGRMLTGPLADRDMLFTFYSRERLLSNEARARWMDPDRAPLALDALLEPTEPA